MKPGRFWLHWIGCLICFFAPFARAEDLMQVYEQALTNDPVFAQARSTWQSAKMNLPIAEASYLPQVATTGSATHKYNHETPTLSSTLNGYTWEYGYTLTLTQPIFNAATWASIKKASANVKAATATYLAAQQSLMQRTAKAYFDALEAYDQLRYTIANKEAVWQQLAASEEKFKVGLIAITDVYDARSNYDQITAQQIAAQNNLDIQLENLRAITGNHYQSLFGIHVQLPMKKPQPNNIEKWVDIANQQNYSVKAQNYTVLAAMQNIKQQKAAGYPTLNLQGGVTETQVSNNPANPAGIPTNTVTNTEDLGLNLAYNPIQGGSVVASTKKARYDYVTAAGQLEQVHRQVVNQARSSFLSVLSGISQVKADKERIIAAQNALDATEAGLKVGTRTMVDVLRALSTLYQAQQQYANDQYSYLDSLIDLKVASGTLSVDDLIEINSWLKKKALFPKEDSGSILKTLQKTATPDQLRKAYSNSVSKKSYDEKKEVAPAAQKTETVQEPAYPQKTTERKISRMKHQQPSSSKRRHTPISKEVLQPLPIPTTTQNNNRLSV